MSTYLFLGYAKKNKVDKEEVVGGRYRQRSRRWECRYLTKTYNRQGRVRRREGGSCRGGVCIREGGHCHPRLNVVHPSQPQLLYALTLTLTHAVSTRCAFLFPYVPVKPFSTLVCRSCKPVFIYISKYLSLTILDHINNTFILPRGYVQCNVITI